jgi:DMSO/TMAO reductase YedYZ heme-binding membrane subunit
MLKLIKYIRYIILCSSIAIALGVGVAVTSIYPETLADIRLGQIFALLAVFYLYLALLASPLYVNFPKAPFKPVYIKARRALGVSAFLFGALHAYHEFFDLLGGFTGLSYLTSKYFFAVLLGALTLTILSIMALTSLDPLVKWLGKGWKPLHRLVYVAGFSIIVHALLLGTHFVDITGWIPVIFFLALFILLSLESLRIDIVLTRKYPNLPKRWVGTILILLVLASIVWLYFVGGAFAAHNHG